MHGFRHWGLSARCWTWGLGLCALALASQETAWAGAWTVPRNRWYVEYFYRYFGSKKVFDPDGNSGRRAKTATFRDIRNEWKLEYGLTDRLNVLASVPYISAHYRDDGVDLLRTGVGDIYVRGKFRFMEPPRAPLVGAAQFSWKIPSAYDPIENPIGDGQVDFESRLQVSRSWLFAPEQVPARRAHRQTPPRSHSAPLAPPADAASDQSAREAAMQEALRHAIMIAELNRQEERLNANSQTEAPAWFHAVEMIPSAEAATDSGPSWMTASEEDANVYAQMRQPDDERFVPATGDELGVETRYRRVAFVNLEGAFSARNEDPANEFPIFIEAGFTPLKRLMLVGSVESVISVKNTDEQTEDFAKWGVRGIVNLWGDGFATVFRSGGPTVNFEVGYNDVFAGRNTADAFEIFGKIGIFF